MWAAPFIEYVFAALSLGAVAKSTIDLFSTWLYRRRTSSLDRLIRQAEDQLDALEKITASRPEEAAEYGIDLQKIRKARIAIQEAADTGGVSTTENPSSEGSN